VQTGFGPFISVYLTAHGWTQVDIGLVLTARGLAALALQMPGGAIVDAARSERGVAALAMIAISASALVIALWPIFPSVLGAQILHAAGSSVVNPAIAAISLGLVGHAASGERFGRNARFASIGNGLAAAGMGAVGYFWSNQAVPGHRRLYHSHADRARSNPVRRDRSRSRPRRVGARAE